MAEANTFIFPTLLENLRPAQQEFNLPCPPDDSPMMRLLKSANQEQLSNSFTERLCEPGEIVFREGEPGDAMFLIWSGQVAVFRGSPQEPAVLAHRCAGEIIGEMALLDDRPRSATVVALEPLRLLSINQACFEQLLVEIPSVGRYIMGILSSRLRRLSEGNSPAGQSAPRPVQPGGAGPEKPLKSVNIELDDALQQKHVAEITESEYFILLQSKAKDLREIINGTDD